MPFHAPVKLHLDLYPGKVNLKGLKGVLHRRQVYSRVILLELTHQEKTVLNRDHASDQVADLAGVVTRVDAQLDRNR